MNLSELFAKNNSFFSMGQQRGVAVFFRPPERHAFAVKRGRWLRSEPQTFLRLCFDGGGAHFTF